jgi:predicted phosphodiesterase
MTRIAACGGVYSNPYALRAFVADASARGAERLLCLGDLGGFGAEPDAVRPLLEEAGIECIAGNYELAVSSGGPECGCGYRDPTDNHFAQVIYEYTLAHTGRDFARWMGTLPSERRLTVDGWTMHLVHGSTLGVNDFWWESLSEDEHRLRVTASGADVVLCTHSGLPWQRRVGTTLVVNVGVLGRPANDGRREVWYCLLDLDEGGVAARLVPLAYDWQAQAASMRSAGLPEVFVESIETGWWTTCLECLPPAERSRGRFHLYRSALPELSTRFGVPATMPDEDGRPVVPLFGSPLLPARLWLDATAVWPPLEELEGLAAEAAAEGFGEVVVIGSEVTGERVHARLAAAAPARIRVERAAGVRRTGDDLAVAGPVREVVLDAEGARWEPARASPDGASDRLVTQRGVPLAEVKRRAIQSVLEGVASDEGITRPVSCTPGLGALRFRR